jgi:DNA-binding NarL/FixJ family response regulator
VSGKTRIVLADEQPIVLNGLRNLIMTESDLELVGEATNGPAALAIIRETRPDVAVVDVSLSGLNGIVLTRRLSTEIPSVGVLVLTSYEDRGFVKQAFEAGARGYVLKRSAAEHLILAVRAVAVGSLYVDPIIRRRLFDVDPKNIARSRNTGGELTERETEVLKLIALGFTNKEIARQLGLGVKSVETYKARGTEKLGLKTRAELVRYAAGQGWLADV